MPGYRWQDEHQRLWSELVPPSGQATSVQGELVRCIGKLTDEAYRNGNCNWAPGSQHDRLLDYIEVTLLGDETFSAERKADIRRDIEEIRDYEHPNVGGTGTCYYKVGEAVVDWCMQHQELIAREIDPALKR
jgi:hypothetical protein